MSTINKAKQDLEEDIFRAIAEEHAATVRLRAFLDRYQAAYAPCKVGQVLELDWRLRKDRITQGSPEIKPLPVDKGPRCKVEGVTLDKANLSPTRKSIMWTIKAEVVESNGRKVDFGDTVYWGQETGIPVFTSETPEMKPEL